MRREVEVANRILVERGATVQRTPVEVVFRPGPRKEVLPDLVQFRLEGVANWKVNSASTATMRSCVQRMMPGDSIGIQARRPVRESS